MTAHGLTPAQVRQWVDSSCAAQGVPVVVTDLGVLTRVGVLLGGGRGQAAARPPRRLQPPPGSNPVRVQTVPAGLRGGQDHGMVEDGFHDRRLAG